MAVKIALESFVAVLRRSKLLTEEQLRSLLEEYQQQFGRTNDSRHFAEFMVAKRAITPWQGDKLLQGKHKGFFLGKYRLLSLVGKGGMSSVYLAEHVLMRRRCAIKVLPARRLQNPSYLARFHREAQAVAALDHRNIVRAYDIDHEMDGDIDIHFLVMEYVDGKGLLDLVVNSDRGRLPPVVAAEYIRQAALGLQHAHSAGLVHRDIKPGNLLVDTQGTVKVLDLGLARFFESTDEVSLTVQHDERVLGTADYLAPEQAVDSHRVDARADIYALGCTLYLCLTGQPPFTQGSLAQRLLAHQTREPPTVESIQPEVPEALGDIVRKMMAKAPNDRYQTAGDVAAALEAWLKTTPKTDLDRSFAGLDRQTPKPGERPREPDPTARKDTVQAGSRADSSATPRVEPRRKPAAPPSAPRAPGKGDQQNVNPGEREPRLAPPAGMPLHQVDEETTIGAPPVRPDRAPTPVPAAADDSPKLEGGEIAPPVIAEIGRVPEPESFETAVTCFDAAALPAPAPVEPLFPEFEMSGLSETPEAAPPLSQEFVFDEDVIVRRPPRKSAATARWDAALQTAQLKTARGREQLLAIWQKARTKLIEKTRTASAKPNVREIDGLRKRRNQSGNVWVIAAAIVGIVVVGLIVRSLITPDSNLGDGKGDPGPLIPRETPKPTVPDDLGPILSVGKEETLTTIDEAIDYVQNHLSNFKGKAWGIQVKDEGELPMGIRAVRSVGGGIPPNGVIESIGTSPAILKPTGDGPVIEIDGVERLTVKRFVLDAGSRSVVVNLPEGFPVGTKLEDLEFRNIGQTGLLCKNVNGFDGAPLQLNGLKFIGASPQAVAIKLQDVRQIRISGCRFLGPMGTGIEFAAGISNAAITVHKCVFHEAQKAVAFSGDPQDLQQIAFINNTFHRVEHALLWNAMPQPASAGLTIKRNLFVGVTQAEAAVSNGFDRALMEKLLPPERNMDNWTDRAESAATGEGTSINLFAQGRRGQTQAFASTDPANPGFLKPTAPSTAIEVKSGEQGADPFVGAIAP